MNQDKRSVDKILIFDLCLWYLSSKQNLVVEKKLERIVGYDLARAYAILGMYMVNFNFCFGNLYDKSLAGRFLSLFTGNSTSIFIMCAGIGLTLMAHKGHDNTTEQKRKTRSVVLKRSWFLLFTGLLLYSWWPGDILHFYGGYMHIAAFILFVPRRYYIWSILGILCLYHIVLFIIPVETSWNLETFEYIDFWTPLGLLRNSLYNGWNSILPWFSYFLLGMWLGRLDWRDTGMRKKMVVVALILLCIMKAVRFYIEYNGIMGNTGYFFMSDYFPPFLPFLLITASFGIVMINVCLWLGEKYGSKRVIVWLANTGRMTLSHYVSHLTIGIVSIIAITGKEYSGLLNNSPLYPSYIVLSASVYYLFSILWGNMWLKHFKNGPMEMMMRRFSS